jgi:phage shock protein E
MNRGVMLLTMKRPDNRKVARVRSRATIAMGLIAALVTLNACGADSATTAPVAVAVAVADEGQGTQLATVISELVTGERGKQLVDQGAIVIDVRTPAEYAAGHVPDSLLIDVSAANFAQQISQLDPNQAYVVYCRSGNRSAVAISQMLAAGFTELYDMGPLTAWAQAGYPVVTG